MKTFTHRFIARLLVEAETPLFVGSGNASLLTDALVQKDANGLPILPGTALAGVLRHSIEDFINPDDQQSNKVDWNDIFGYQSAESNKGLGSRFKISAGYFVLGNNQVAEALNGEIDDALLSKIANLPTRQHVRITDKGVADTANRGLFDNEVMYKGARFKFEIELKGIAEDDGAWEEIVSAFKSPVFRIGQGTRNGYGKLRVIGLEKRVFNLNEAIDYEDYLLHNASLNILFKSKNQLTEKDDKTDQVFKTPTTHYQLQLTPDRFFIFSEGFGDDEVDNKPITEEVMIYTDSGIKFIEQTLIPASSVKGAISHRVCYHYNKMNEWYADTGKAVLGDENPAVKHFFGSKGDTKGKIVKGQRGNLIFSDLHYTNISNDKILNHVAIDRFTGGAMDGALFSEKVSFMANGKIVFDIYAVTPLDNNMGNADENKEKALEEALKDICKGLLPLGGMTTKGNGMLTGILTKNGNEIYSYT